MPTYTTNLKIALPINNESGWGTTLNGNSTLIDGLAPIGSLFCSTAESPSTTLNVRVTAGSYPRSGGQIGTYAGAASFAVPASATSNLWLADGGVLTAGAAWPGTPHVRLATVAAGATTITSVSDQRLATGSAGASRTIASQTVTAAYTVLPTDGQIRADATAGAFTVTLPAANVVPGLVVRIIKVDSSANAVTVGSTSNINGAATIALSTQYQGAVLVADGTANAWNSY